MIGLLLLGPKGIHSSQRLCSACSEQGGGGDLKLDPRTGEPERCPKVILLDIEFSDWLKLHGQNDFPGAYGLTIKYLANLDRQEAEQASTATLACLEHPEPDLSGIHPLFPPAEMSHQPQEDSTPETDQD
jgi:hypothetical protein